MKKKYLILSLAVVIAALSIKADWKSNIQKTYQDLKEKTQKALGMKKDEPTTPETAQPSPATKPTPPATQSMPSAPAPTQSTSSELGMAEYSKGNYAAALMYFKQDQDNPESLRNMAALYRRGLGIPKDEAMAKQLEERAAELEQKETDELSHDLFYKN